MEGGPASRGGYKLYTDSRIAKRTPTTTSSVAESLSGILSTYSSGQL